MSNRPLASSRINPPQSPETGGRNLTPSPFRGGLGRGFKDLCKRSNERRIRNHSQVWRSPLQWQISLFMSKLDFAVQ